MAGAFERGGRADEVGRKMMDSFFYREKIGI